MSKPFKFKQFTINQDRCAMKIGTDGVLLGSWVTLKHSPFSILDVGAGTGVIALMLAQRANAELIDAIEIEENAYEQCVENFEMSPWSDRLFCYHASLQEFAEEIEDKYDLIVSNPPFYSEDYKTKNKARDTARFQDALPFEHLVVCTVKLLSKDGKFCTIIPFNQEQEFIKFSSKAQLHPNTILRVKGSPESNIKRSLIEFSFKKTPINETELIIETKRHQFTNQYINLTKDFYLNL